MQVSLRNVVLYPYDDVAAFVATLSGLLLPAHRGEPIVMDDVNSYRIAADYGVMRLTAEGLTRLMDRHVLPSSRTAIKHVEVAFGDRQMSIRGTIVKLGIPVPFEARAEVRPTQSGDLRVHTISLLAAGVLQKGVIDALGLDLSTLAQPAHQGVFHIEGDDLIVPVVSLLPPPRVSGHLTSIKVTPAGMEVVLGQATSRTEHEVSGASFAHLRHGSLRFGKLTMRDADLSFVPEDDRKPLGLSALHYYAQLQAGYSKSLPDFGLIAHVRDFRDVGSGVRTR